MRAIDVVQKLCPRARAEYIAAFEAGDRQIAAAGITTPARLARCWNWLMIGPGKIL